MADTLEQQLLTALAAVTPHDMTKSEKELLDLVKKANPGTAGDLAYDNVLISPAAAVAGRPDGRTAQAVLVGIPEKGISEKPKSVFYYRVDLGILFQQINASVGLGVKASMTTWDLIPAINAKYGTTFTEDDIVKTVVDGTVLPGTATIAAVDGNVKYVGQFTVTFDNSALLLSDIVLDDSLEGFNYPNSDTTKGQATIYSYSLEAAEESVAFWTALEVDTALPAAAADHINALYGLDNDEIWAFKGTTPATYNLEGAMVKYVGTNDAAAILASLGIQTNPIFGKVAIFQLAEPCSNFAGLFMVGWELQAAPAV